MNRGRWKDMIAEFVERFDEAIIQGIMTHKNAVLVNQQAETSGELREYGANRNGLIRRRSD